MSKGMMRILSNCLTILRPAFLRSDLPLTIAFMAFLSFLVRVGKEKGARPRIRNKNYETQLKNNPEQ
jgi:hypothetical protein